MRPGKSVGSPVPLGSVPPMLPASPVLQPVPFAGRQCAPRPPFTLSSSIDPSIFRPGARHLLTENDIYLFREGTHASLYDGLGCHLHDAGAGRSFAVWAPNAAKVSVIGDWNGWGARDDALAPRWDGSGIWEGSIPAVQRGQAYKYRIVSRWNGFTADKADPLGFFSRAAARHRLARLVARMGVAATATGWHRAPRATGSPRRSRSTRCTSARGGARTAIS